jgi:hypothetical protein
MPLARSFRQPKVVTLTPAAHEDGAAEAARACGAEVRALRPDTHRCGGVRLARAEVLEPEACPLPKHVRKRLKAEGYREHPAPAGYARRWVHG